MLLDLKFSIGTLGIGSGAFVASLYGMNLKNFIEESNLGFLGVTAWSVIFAAMVCTYGLKKLRKVQRLSMGSEEGIGGRRSWMDLNTMPAFPGESRTERMKRLQHGRHEALKDGAAHGTDSVEALPLAVKKKR